MKHHLFALSLAGLLVCIAPGYAQEGGTPIKVTSVLHNDGTRTDTQTDIDSRTSEAKTYSASKKLLERCVFTLDAQGRELEGVLYNDKDVVVSRVSFQYDAQGNLAEKVVKAANGTLQRRFVFSRDATGRMNVQAFDGKGNLVKSESGIVEVPPQKSSQGGKR